MAPWCQVPRLWSQGGTGSEMAEISLRCLPAQIREVEEIGGEVMIYFYIALFSHCSQVVEWFLT